MLVYITDDIEIPSGDSNEEISNSENSHEENFDEENCNYRISIELQNIILISSDSLNTHITYITHTIKLILKHIKKN